MIKVSVRKCLAWGTAVFLIAGAVAVSSGALANGAYPSLLNHSEMVTTIGASPPACQSVGGPNCGNNSKACDASACPTEVTCKKVNDRCVVLDIGPTTINDCSKNEAEGNCCAVCGANCTSYWTGELFMGVCNQAGVTVCDRQVFCGASLCNTYACGATPPPPPTNPVPPGP